MPLESTLQSEYWSLRLRCLAESSGHQNSTLAFARLATLLAAVAERSIASAERSVPLDRIVAERGNPVPGFEEA